ncbi:RM10 protein, partial [Formicarius rufipectus]|nr:RM10 protein [Formicarius rufipectus]
QEDGYVRLLRRQVQEMFRSSRMVAVCQYNSMPDEDLVAMRHYLRKHNIEVKFVLNEVGWADPGGKGASWLAPDFIPRCLSQIVRPVLEQSKWKNLLPLFVCRNILLVSPETRAKEMLRVLKRIPQVNLLGACIDDTILSRQGVENFARLPSLETSQGHTVGALALLPSQTSSLLQRGLSFLTVLLEEHIRRLRDTDTPGEPPGEQSTGGH